MPSSHNLRKTGREDLDHPLPAVLFFEKHKGPAFRFVIVLNLSIQGVLIESDIDFGKESNLNLAIRNPELNQWDTFFCRVAWNKDNGKCHHLGIEFLFHVENAIEDGNTENNGLCSKDLDFILNNHWLSGISGNSLCRLLNCMSRHIVKKGTAFITQGERGDCLYIIQKGDCLVQVSRQRTLQTIAHKKPGDVVGDMSFLSSESRTATVVSKTKMILWKLSKNRYDKACQSVPDIRTVLTRLLTRRLEDPICTGINHVDRYGITHRMDQSELSVVYKGVHLTLNLPVVVKMISHHPAMDTGFSKRFKRRAPSVIRLNHPNIVRTYDIKTRHKTFFVITEYFDGESLAALLKRNRVLPFQRALAFLIQLCKALSYAHEKNIIHQDVRPENLFVLKNDVVKLMNFGLACSPFQENFYHFHSAHYLSPEQMEGEAVDHRTDIYSLGILAYEMLTGEKPFEGEDIMTLMEMHTTRKIPDPAILIPDLPEALSRVIATACAILPSERYNTMAELLDELSAIEHVRLKESIPESDKDLLVLLAPHNRDQRLALITLLDEFSQRAKEIGVSLKIAGPSS